MSSSLPEPLASSSPHDTWIDFDADAVVIDHHDVSDFNPENILPETADVQASIRHWLNPTQYDGDGSEYQAHLSSHLPGTGDWVFNSTIYQEWHDSDEDGILWIRGIPGAGKSVLVSSSIHHLKQENVPVLYFFLRHTLDTNNSPEALLRDWLAQVLEYSPALQRALSARICQNSSTQQDLSSAELWRYLYRALTYLPKGYCVMDAMDEMDSERLEPLVKCLDALGRWRPAEIKLVATSRPVAVVEKIFSRVKTLDVQLDKERVERDIVRYVQHRLGSSSVPPERHKEVEEAILHRADGLFLYAKLALDSFLRPGISLPTNLEDMPADLTRMYTTLLQDHSNRTAGAPAGLQEFVLQLVTHATRSLRLLEIADLVRVTQVQGDLGEIKDLIRSLCGPLLQILPDETVRVVHHSLTEYLKGMPSTSVADGRIFPVFSLGPTHHRLAMACLSYLASGCLESVDYKKRSRISGDVNYPEPASLKANQVLPPSTLYAGANWPVHVRRAVPAGQDQADFNEVLDSLLAEPNLDKLEVLVKTHMDFQPTPLHFAIGLELQEYASHLLSDKKAEYMKDGRLQDSLIIYAAYKGCERMVKLLLNHGADLKSTNERGRTPLHAAVTQDHVKAAAVLIDAGANIEVARGDDNYFGMPGEAESPWTPLERVFSCGSLEMSKLFYKRLQTPTAVSKALYHAVSGKNTPAIELLLQHTKLDINKAHRDGPPLFVACLNRDVGTIRLLLKSGAAVKAGNDASWMKKMARVGDGTYTSMLHAWAGNDHHRVYNRPKLEGEEAAKGVSTLLSHGADVDQVTTRGETPLHLANDVATVRSLLEGGANPNALNRRGESLLHVSYNMEILDSILPWADLNLQTHDAKRTPLLHTLAGEGFQDQMRVEKVLWLIDSGADVEAVDSYGNSALHYAAGMPDVGTLVVEKLCSGLNVSLKNHEGKTPLHMIAPGSGLSSDFRISASLNPTVFHALLAAGGDINARDNRGVTLLFQYIENSDDFPKGRRQSWFDALVQAGAKTDTLDSKGRSLLHAQVFNVNSEPLLLEMIRSKGVDPTHTDHEGNTLFHEAALKLAKMGPRPRAVLLAPKLTEMGVDAARPNCVCRTPLHLIASTNPGPFDWSQSELSGRHGSALNSTAPTCGVDFYLRQYLGPVDPVDKHGVRPLHIASTFSEYITRRLLEEGASPSNPTMEGLTPLHLAARSRQANIIGILLDKLQSTSTPEEITAVLDTKDKLNRTALYYAAASGRVESFKLLLGAGATLDHHVYAGSLWNGCANFEEEAGCWPDPTPQHALTLKLLGNSDNTINAGGVAISDISRPSRHETMRAERVFFPVERLSEILDILASSAPKDQISFVDQAISSASEKRYDYTVECLLQAREQLAGNAKGNLDEKTKFCLDRRQERAASDARRKGNAMINLMQSRSYSEVVDRLTPANCLDDTSRDTRPSFVSQLALGGFTALLSKAASEEVISHTIGLKEQGQGAERDGTLIQPLLIYACSAEMPNMDVVRMLVEDKNVNVNEPKFERSYSGFAKGPTALHILAGGYHWWQSSQGIPYLVQHGADLEALEEDTGLTPLGYALRNINLPHFSKPAVKALLAFGASPDKADRFGNSYLSWTIQHPEMFQLLVQKGAVITRSTLEAAIGQPDIDVLQMLLSNGADPNERTVGEERAEIWHSETSCTGARSDPASTAELYLIEWVATELCRGGKKENEVYDRIFEMLLEYGADPFAPYLRTTVLHRVIENRGLHSSSGGQNRYLDLLLDRPGLDLDTRDSKGMTLLLLAAKRDYASDESSLRVMQKLLDRGADIYARDHDGRSAMHHGIRSRKLSEFVLRKAPELMDSPDKGGKTPLHHALDSIRGWGSSERKHDTACDLIQSGAEVTRPDNNGTTPLHLVLGCAAWIIRMDNSVGGPCCDLLHSLVAKGADVNARTNDGETPIFGYFRESSVKAEIDESEQSLGTADKNDWRFWFLKEERGGEAAVQKEGILWTLFEHHSVDLHAVNEAGQGLLHLVAQEKGSEEYQGRRVARFKYLMKKGLDPLREDKDYRTPLDLADAFGNEDILALFKQDK